MTRPVLKPTRFGYLPSLDGWRAVAILAVMMYHDLPWIIAGHSNARIKTYGMFGVHLFFAISGFLITTRILEEESLAGHFDIARFYIRRLFRIQPAAFAYLATIALLMLFGIVHEHWYFWSAALLLFENFTRHAPNDSGVSFFTGHFWTLAIEEHFYILLSLTLVLFRRNRIAVLATLYFGLLFATHWAQSHGHAPVEYWQARNTQWQLHFLLLPALAAALLRHKVILAFATRYLRPWIVFLATSLFVFLHPLESQLRHGIFTIPRPNFSLEAVYVYTCFFLLWIIATVFHPDSLTTRLLETPPLRFIGRISYSLYLWHMLFFFPIEPATNITNPILLALSTRPAKWIAAFAVATLSYYFIEKPLVRLGHRLAPAASPGRPELADLPTQTSV